MKERRTRQEIYVDILDSIELESKGGKIKLTRIQLASELSFDKAKKHILALEEFGLVQCKPVIKITEKGMSFKKISKEVMGHIELIKKEYLSKDQYVDEDMLIKTQTIDKTQFFLHSKEHDETHEICLLQKIKDQKQVELALKAIIEELE